jgi:hypothetical protein
VGAAEVRIVVGATLLVAEVAEVAAAPEQPNAMLLNCQVVVEEEKVDQTKPVIALALALEN